MATRDFQRPALPDFIAAAGAGDEMRR